MAGTLLATAVAWTGSSTAAPGPDGWNAGRIQQRLAQLPVVASALYVAAHPDDENTRLIAWLANERLARTAYLSLTRGGGGQNLIGDEQGPHLAAIRTQELLAARAVDGGEQYFTRARDYGYSKSAEEALATWGHDEVLADVVWAIRAFRPDVIITRFDPTDPNTHGHHVASAQLAVQAWEAAADPNRFAEQFELGVQPWKAVRVVRNVSTWRMAKDADMSAYFGIDVGTWSAALGTSMGEIAATSRSMHKSQGFGAASQRGRQMEYFEWLAGEPLTDDLFAGVDTSANRLGAGDDFAKAAHRASMAFRADTPAAAIDDLLDARRALDGAPPEPWVSRKRAEVDALLLACAGVWWQVRAAYAAAAVGDDVEVTLEVLLRNRHAAVEWAGASLAGMPLPIPAAVGPNEPQLIATTLRVPSDAPISQSDWSLAGPNDGLYQVPDPARIAAPEPAPAFAATLEFRVDDQTIQVDAPLVHTWVDPVQGERVRPFWVAPPVTLTPAREVTIHASGAQKEIAFEARSWSHSPVRAALAFEAPPGWTIQSAKQEVTLPEFGSQQSVSVRIRPASASTPPADIVGVATVNGAPWRVGVTTIEHDHIPPQWVFGASSVRAVPIRAESLAKRVLYVHGAGDRIPEALAELGVAVDVWTPDQLADRAQKLAAYDAVVFGVRAFNVHESLRHRVPALLDYVKAGGTWIVQYTTNNWISKLDYPIAPASISIGRGRVTDENAPVVALDPTHPVVTQPNALVPADFDGWVQERGLYFAESWEPPLAPVFEVADPGEEAQQGILLTARHGKGAFVYSGFSLFRQLPAGVPGAYRLLANLVSLGQSGRTKGRRP